MLKKAAGIAVLLIFMITVSGCISASSENMMSAPKLSGEYLSLQNKIDQIVRTGQTQVSPEKGTNRYTIQLMDIDADGDDESISFFRNNADTTQYTIYVHKKNESNYEEIGKTEGRGLGISAVYYPCRSEDGMLATVILWEASEDVNGNLSVCIADSDGFREILSAEYTKLFISDLGNDGINELLLITKSASLQTYTASFYMFSGSEITKLQSIALSSGIRSIDRIRQGMTSDGKDAVFIDEVSEEKGYMTDVLYVQDGVAANVSIDRTAGRSIETYREVLLPSADMNGDGVCEIPLAYPMPGYHREDKNTQWLIGWNSMGTDGELSLVMETYYNAADGWYIVWPEDWKDRITARTGTAEGCRFTEFCEYSENKENIPLFYIYTFQGTDSSIISSIQGLKTIGASNTRIYCISFPEGEADSSLNIDEEQIRRIFKIITQAKISPAS